jgi:hypothetical protein
MQPNWGGFGGGEMKSYALWVTTRFEAEVGADIEAGISRLPPIGDESGSAAGRAVKCWIPQKPAMKWNGRYVHASRTPCLLQHTVSR